MLYGSLGPHWKGNRGPSETAGGTCTVYEITKRNNGKPNPNRTPSTEPTSCKQDSASRKDVCPNSHNVLQPREYFYLFSCNTPRYALSATVLMFPFSSLCIRCYKTPERLFHFDVSCRDHPEILGLITVATSVWLNSTIRAGRIVLRKYFLTGTFGIRAKASPVSKKKKKKKREEFSLKVRHRKLLQYHHLPLSIFKHSLFNMSAAVCLDMLALKADISPCQGDD